MMKRQLAAAVGAVILALGLLGSPASAEVLPLTVVAEDAGVGYVTLTATNPNAIDACFEYRSDGDTSQASGEANPNTAYSDQYPFFCLTGSSDTRTYQATAYVEIRSVFGGAGEVGFDWMRFEVLPEPSDTIAFGETANVNETDQGSGQDQNQDSDQHQVSSQHSHNEINQVNTVSGDAGADVSSGCDISQEGNSPDSVGMAGCDSTDTTAEGWAEGGVTQSSTSSQVATISNSQFQAQSGGSQTNSSSNSTEQNAHSGASNIGGNVDKTTTSTVDDHSDDDRVDNENGVINNSTHTGDVQGDNNDVNDAGAVGGLLDELAVLITDAVNDDDPGVINNS